MVDTMYGRVTLDIETCCNCGTPFGIEHTLRMRFLDERPGATFYCPNGHAQHYLGKTDVQRERDARIRAEARAARAEDQAEVNERRRRAEKGQRTRILNRIHNGVCPHCKRTFADLSKHMESKHADLIGARVPDAG